MININEAINIINNRRNLAEIRLYNLQNKLRQDKVFLELENKLGELDFEIAKKVAYKQDFGDLKQQYNDTKKKFVKRLKELGVSEKDLEIQYTCQKCKDTGFVNGQRCNCLKNLIYDSLKSNCGDLETELNDFSNLNFDIYSEDNKNGYLHTYTLLEKYTELFPKIKPYMFIYGKTGVGKSFMSSLISNVIMKKGYSVLYLNACKLNQIFLNYHLAHIQNKQEIFEPLLDCDLLVVDDLGNEISYNNVTTNYLYMLMLERAKKNTIFTSNLDLKGIENKYTQRIASRFIDVSKTIKVPIEGKDLRLEQNK